MNHLQEDNDDSNGPTGIPAGDFSEWLRNTEASLQSGKGGADVPCGTCTACCRSSMFIHIKPHETQTIQRIPRALLFPAPGMPKGNVVMGYSDKGHCPMLVHDKCSIYQDRPQTCREYDCRIVTATGVAVDQQSQPEVARRTEAWVFHYEGESSSEEHRILKEAAAFLQKNRDLFPQGSLPNHPAQLAALAVRIYRLFSAMTGKAHQAPSATENAAIARAIMTAFPKPDTQQNTSS